MKAFHTVFLCAVCLLLMQPGSALFADEGNCDAQELKVDAEFETGKLYRKGKFNILELSGSYRFHYLFSILQDDASVSGFRG